MRRSGLFKIIYNCPKTIAWSRIGDHGWIGCYNQSNCDHCRRYGESILYLRPVNDRDCLALHIFNDEWVLNQRGEYTFHKSNRMKAIIRMTFD